MSRVPLSNGQAREGGKGAFAEVSQLQPEGREAGPWDKILRTVTPIRGWSAVVDSSAHGRTYEVMTGS